jgi:hypothetical protein
MFYNKINELEKALSLDYISQVITIGKKQFIFGPPSTPREEKQQARLRKQLIKILLKDAAQVMAEEAFHDWYDFQDVNRDTAWDTIDAILKHIPTREQVASPIATESYDAIKVDAHKQVGLNYESYQVKMQDPKLEIEDAD